MAMSQPGPSEICTLINLFRAAAHSELRKSRAGIPLGLVRSFAIMKPLIESLQNPKIKLAHRLRDSRYRRRTGQIVIDGLREIEVAYRAGVVLETIFYPGGQGESSVPPPAMDQWPAELLQPVAERVFEKVTYGQRVSQAVAVATAPLRKLENLRLPAEPLLLVLDQVEKPGNIGAVARTAATAGADALVLADPACEVFNPNAIRSSLGTVFSLPIAVCTATELQSWLDKAGIRVVRACVDGAVSLWQIQLGGPLAIVLGSEAHGLGRQWDRPGWQAVQIPMTPGADSLNLSVSAAVLCYEALRQRAVAAPTIGAPPVISTI
jgi:TrmH family RNA methyltransferase